MLVASKSDRLDLEVSRFLDLCLLIQSGSELLELTLVVEVDLVVEVEKRVVDVDRRVVEVENLVVDVETGVVEVENLVVDVEVMMEGVVDVEARVVEVDLVVEVEMYLVEDVDTGVVDVDLRVVDVERGVVEVETLRGAAPVPVDVESWNIASISLRKAVKKDFLFKVFLLFLDRES